MRPQGLEPWTYWLKASYSTIELWSQKLHNKKVAAAKVPPSFAFRGISLYNYCKGPTTLCSSVGLLYRNCCKTWWTQGNSNPYSSRERAMSWPLDDGSRKWCLRRDSNSQPTDYKSVALPLCYRGKNTIQILNSEESRVDFLSQPYTTIILYKVLQVNWKNSIQINNLKGSQFSVREGKFIGTLGLLSYLKKMRASRITQRNYSNII